MIGREFLDTARILATSSRPADLRTAVSRAYYATYHAAYNFLHSSGVRFSRNSPEAHTKIPQCFENANVPNASEIARLLKSLRTARNQADYQMDHPVFEDTISVNNRIAMAIEALQALDAITSGPDRAPMQAILKNCARGLGLTVV